MSQMKYAERSVNSRFRVVRSVTHMQVVEVTVNGDEIDYETIGDPFEVWTETDLELAKLQGPERLIKEPSIVHRKAIKEWLDGQI